MIWTRDSITDELRKLHQRGVDLAYNAMAKKRQSLLSAAAYHFGSYRKAIEKAGIDYASVSRRPRWTKQEVIALIKAARRRDDDLHWSAVTRRRDDLGRAAFAALQPRLFGSWDRALHAAGLDADEIARYRSWDKASIVAELRARLAEELPLNSGSLQTDDPGLHAAAVRHFGSYDAALGAAHIDPASVRRRRTWTKEQVVKALRQMRRKSRELTDTTLRRTDAALYGAALRLFGSFTAARTAAGLPATTRGATDRTTGRTKRVIRKAVVV